ncbi:pentatricopeptide repeat-containing protein At2g44880-like [Magnolia sinica]|uniref:pentatricopeptide repeat-containing protein At2g44880-like n=1 Tax=Magnolia sinica TaxID=86752 RepID=UPI002658E41A|nr:pentatricopeptide repeat-containing protein At2g44880-like [Magnolia sinica]XP_058076572.1 pentatricopeptide repeat-containing protein At2g44880-like [Magnolia sinica]XP_058076573.1 pentatricopeptide repeat-containing protein At2g44880-like [Magnolia sinica]XP_058076574.1 pentatricopeptide repeat-containing protein At2g44880-like [Magnolia sinica]XP_058076575.1 pentatricopeptide repeat-containing protein At2g44880-like [Magnolia sinica]XP_058076576.1 pentatricopeptide repeat-containing prot
MNESTAAATLWSPKEKQCISLLLQHQQQKRGWSTARNPLLQIHAFILRHALDSNLSLLTKFISACSDPTPASDPLAGIRHARRVFDNRRSQDAFLCNSMIRAYLQNCQFRESVYLYRSLRQEGCFAPDNYTFPFLVKSCASNLAVEVGQQLHNQVIKMGIYFDLYVSTAMVDMYAKFGKVESSRRVFDEMPHKSPASWTAVIVGYARSGDVEIARELFEWMPNKDPASFNAMIDAVAKSGNVVLARQLFDEMPERNVISWTSMISGYCKNGNLDAARCLFDSMPEKNLFSWNVMIGGYCQNKQPHPALELFRQLQFDSSLQPDEVTAVSIIPAIADLGALDLGCWIHSYVRKKRLDRSSSVLTALIDMYAKCGEIQKAQQVFHKMPQKEVASWNAMINGFAVNGRAREALEVFLEMLSGGVKPNEVTMIGVLSACSHGGLVEEGKKWFSAMVEYGIDRRIEHYGCMVDLLGRAGHVEEAEELIERMPCEVNGIVLSSLLFACGCHGDVRRAERVMRKALELEPWNVGNHVMLRNMYAGERRWEDMAEVKGMMRRNGAKKEVGSSVIEVNCRVWEFVAGDRMHPKWELIYEVLGNLRANMMVQKGKEVWQLMAIGYEM